jgi:hypothetical protein
MRKQIALQLLVPLNFLVIGALFGSTAAQAEPVATVPSVEREDEEDFVETAPPTNDISYYRVERVLLNASKQSVIQTKSVISRLIGFNTANGPIPVCFRDGDPDDPRIAAVIRHAQAWQFPNSSVRFDFGPSDAPHRCDRLNQAVIRISFSEPGTWSVIGLQSIFAGTTTMNFDARSGYGRPDGQKFRRAVQHEFGHALGLYHEHQNPNGTCVDEIDWKVALPVLRTAGYSRSDDEIISNFGRLHADVTASSFDGNSIMLYDLPKEIFKAELFEAGSKPNCFHNKVNYEISEDDRKAILNRYPADPAKVRELRAIAFEDLRALFPEGEKGNQALAVAASFFPFGDEEEAKPFVNYTKWTIEQEN